MVGGHHRPLRRRLHALLGTRRLPRPSHRHVAAAAAPAHRGRRRAARRDPVGPAAQHQRVAGLRQRPRSRPLGSRVPRLPAGARRLDGADGRGRDGGGARRRVVARAQRRRVRRVRDGGGAEHASRRGCLARPGGGAPLAAPARSRDAASSADREPAEDDPGNRAAGVARARARAAAARRALDGSRARRACEPPRRVAATRARGGA